MLKITDRYKFDAEEIKTELIAYTSDIRMQFDKVLTSTEITEEQRLQSLNCLWNHSAAIFTFLATKAGIDVRAEDGGMLADKASGYFMAKIFDVKQRIKKSQGGEG